MNILRTIKYILCVAVLAACLPAAYGYSLNGPVSVDTWQTPTIGYDPDTMIPDGAVTVGTTTIAIPGINSQLTIEPKNIGEEYRPNIPTWYYAYDASFLDYFGSNGVVSVDQAFNIMNASFTYTNSIATNSIGVDGFSQSMTEFPDFSQHLNTSAYGLGLTDIKSEMLNTLMLEMGLQQPERFVWTLRQAFLPPGGVCPLDEEFEVIQRNYGITPSPQDQIQYSSYINDELYTFYIFYWNSPPTAICSIPPGEGNDQFRTVPYPVNPFDQLFTTVASGDNVVGTFYSGLTRDDLAGFRYLLSTNNVNYENPATGSLLLTTNLGAFTTITSSNLTTLLLFANTNTPGVTASTFGVTVTGTNTPTFGTITNWTYTATLTTPPGAPYGTQIITLVSNPVVSFQEFFVDTFGNVITNGNLANFPGIIQECSNTLVLNYSSTSTAQLETTSVSISGQNGGTYGSGTLTTNTTVTTVPVTYPNGGNVPSGEYITLPVNTGNNCGWQVLCASPIPNVVSTTNMIASATDANGFVGSQFLVTTFTNHTYLVEPIICATATPSPGLYQGIDKLNFVQADYDSLLGQFFDPITNKYSMQLVTNSQVVVQYFQRVVTAPDWLIQAADTSGALPVFNEQTVNTPNFVHDPGNAYAALASPGTINPAVDFTFNKVGDMYLNGSLASYGLSTNITTAFNENTESAAFVYWGSFDASTNPPVVYPDGASIQNLANEMLIQVSPAPPSLPNGTHGVAYPSTPFTASGGAFTQPYSWSATGLPSGLTLTTNPNSTATLSGTPSQSGTFDITVQLTDYNGRSVTWNYILTIN